MLQTWRQLRHRTSIQLRLRRRLGEVEPAVGRAVRTDGLARRLLRAHQQEQVAAQRHRADAGAGEQEHQAADPVGHRRLPSDQLQGDQGADRAKQQQDQAQVTARQLAAVPLAKAHRPDAVDQPHLASPSSLGAIVATGAASCRRPSDDPVRDGSRPVDRS